MTTQQIENPSVYDASYFIAKFEAIPEELWNDNGSYEGPNGCRCAYGHCGMTDGAGDRLAYHEEADGLMMIDENFRSCSVISVNDGYKTSKAAGYTQPTPKQRVLAWLRDAQKAGL